MFLYLILFGILSGAPVAWLLRNDASWWRIALAVPAGIVTGFVAAFIVGTILAGGKPTWMDPTWGVILGPLGAVIAARRQYGTPRAPDDLRG
jgi:hypothetical protein